MSGRPAPRREDSGLLDRVEGLLAQGGDVRMEGNELVVSPLEVLSASLFGLSRTLDDVGRASPGSVVAAPLHQATLSTRARSNTNPARPYICRLIVFNRFT